MPDPITAKILALLTSQAAQNGADAAGGGILAAIFGGRKTPAKLIFSAFAAMCAGIWWGGASAEIFAYMFLGGEPTATVHRAFSSAIGVVSFPLFMVLPEVVRKKAGAWASK